MRARQSSCLPIDCSLAANPLKQAVARPRHGTFFLVGYWRPVSLSGPAIAPASSRAGQSLFSRVRQLPLVRLVSVAAFSRSLPLPIRSLRVGKKDRALAPSPVG